MKSKRKRAIHQSLCKQYKLDIEEAGMKDYEKVMEVLNEIPGVTDYLDSFTAKIGREIFALRLKYELSQKELASLAQVAQTIISRVEAGDPKIKGGTYNKIMNALNVNGVLIK